MTRCNTTTREALTTYLRVVDEPAVLIAITKYMYTMHQASPGATRTELYRLCKAGLVERVGVGLYRWIGVPLAQLEQSQRH